MVIVFTRMPFRHRKIPNMGSALARSVFLFRTILFIGLLALSVNGLLRPICEMDNSDPHVDDVITLTCRPAVNDSSDNITLTWFHDGKNISLDQQSGVIRTKLSSADYGVSFTCREAQQTDKEQQSCTIMPLENVLPTPQPTAGATSGIFISEVSTWTWTTSMLNTTDVDDSPSDPDPRQDTITILFIAIVVAGGVPLLVVIVGCIVWLSRKTQSDHRSYTVNNTRPLSDSFDDYDVEAAVDNRPAAPLPTEMQSMKSSSVKNGAPPVLKSLVQKAPLDAEYSMPPEENLYQNTAMGPGGCSTLPVAATSKNVYLVPKCSPADSKEDLCEDNVKIYENTGFGNKQQRFEADQTASLPIFKY